MQRGISVELPVTHNAVPMPDADREESLVVSVTKDGNVYFGVNPIGPAALADTIKDRLSNRAEKKLYIKADARTPFANVVRVLGSARNGGCRGTEPADRPTRLLGAGNPSASEKDWQYWSIRRWPLAQRQPSRNCSTRANDGPRGRSTMSRFPGLVCEAH
jgi:Biopolymer transport protein ExbD/TolR